jgi:hypothetical protein
MDRKSPRPYITGSDFVLAVDKSHVMMAFENATFVEKKIHRYTDNIHRPNKAAIK